MSHRVKEEERIERIIRSLLKLPANRRCINCNSLGPQYVCTTFWTFVCTCCSGVHREFTHRVKSVSMAKFSADEVNSLQAGGNERARELYFKTWDPQRNSFPDGGNLHRIREFIKHVYEDRRFTGERGSDRLAMVKMDAKGGFYERRSFEKSGNYSRDEYYEQHSFDRSGPSSRNEIKNLRNILEDRSPRYKENVRSGSSRNRPARFEIVDDRFRDDGYGVGRRYERQRVSTADHQAGSLSPEPQKIRGTSLPALRPAKDILGNSASSLKVGEPPKARDGSNIDGPHAQKTAPTSSPGSIHGKGVEEKTVNSTSLIDFSTEPELPATSVLPQMQQTAPSSGGNSSVQSYAGEKASPSPPHLNTLESLLFELSTPVAPAAPQPPPVVSTSKVPNSHDASPATPVALSNVVRTALTAPTAGNKPALPSNSEGSSAKASNAVCTTMAAPTLGNSPALPITEGQELLTLQQCQPSASPTVGSSSTTQQSASSREDLHNQQSWPSPPHNTEAQTSNPSAEQSSQAAPKPTQETSSGEGPKSTTRKELPADIFTSSYASYPAPVPNWQFRPPRGMGYGVQYLPNAVPGFRNAAKSTNPFDISDDAAQVQTPMFPSMVSLQGALPHVSAHTGLQHPSSPYAHAMPPPQSASYGMSLSPGAYMGQPPPNSMLVSRAQGINNSGSGESAFAYLNPLPQSSGKTHAPTTPNSFSALRGNPFG